MKRLSFLFIVVLIILACNLPTSQTQTSVPPQTAAAMTVAVISTGTASAQPTTVPATETPIPTDTSIPTVIPTQQPPTVIKDALCWVGPGNVYDVVSAIKTGTQVELLGQGSLAGWLVVRNPIYHDPCWIESSNVHIDPSFNIASLPIVYPPPTPTPTASKTPVPSATPTP
ncbi:MAG TPA: hypothetical protein VMT73_00520 [Anaerolineales bacterium]|nr:hypothetical protein [Anaerolineales bacterium]